MHVKTSEVARCPCSAASGTIMLAQSPKMAAIARLCFAASSTARLQQGRSPHG